MAARGAGPAKNVSGLPDWDKPRDPATGQFLSKNKSQMHEQWSKEGGLLQTMTRINEVQSTILSASSDAAALRAHAATLPEDIRLIAADHMRLATGYGHDAGSRKFGQFLDALSPSQFETFHKWWRGLSRGNQDAILGGISK